MINGVPFGEDRIRAWSVSTETGYTFSHTRFRPRPLLRVDAYSGDRDAAGRTLGTYNPYFPRGAHFTPKAIPSLGPQNLTDLHPVLQFRARQNVTGEISWNWYWARIFIRWSLCLWQRRSGRPIQWDPREISGRSGRHGNSLGSGEAHCYRLNVAGFRPSGFLTQFPNHRSPIVANVGLTYRF